MYCNKCGAQIPAESRFCNKCGAPLTPAGAMPAPAGPSAQEPEQDLWAGRLSAKAYGHWMLLWLVWAAVVGYVWFSLLPPGMREKAFAGWIVLAAVGIPALVLAWNVAIGKIATRYRLTTYRLFRETGILSRHMNEIELIRVDDVSVRQNLIQRIFNVGVITVVAPTDQTEPRLDLVGVRNPIEIKEQIRTHVRKRRERSLHVESL